MTERPTLSWVDIDDVIKIAKHRFEKAIKSVQDEGAAATRVDPTLAIARASILGQRLVVDDDIDASVSITKTIQNAVGLFHQDVLGAVSGWASSGASGGSMDLRGKSPVTGKEIVAEVKMRWNTIKASDEKNVWDDLKHAAVLQGRESVGYVFQIIPKTNQPYDVPWKVSGRESLDRIRCADGVTAYHLVTGNPKAIFELFSVLPFVMTEAVTSVLGDGTNARIAFENSDSVVGELLAASLPIESAHPTAKD